MSFPTPTKMPCSAEIHSHQYYSEVVCHALGVTADGHPFALIERKDGSVDVLRLDGCYSIKLIGSTP